MSEPLLKTPCIFGENGNFLLERELGHGGMGGVYMGRDKMLDRPVAVKVMLKEYGADAEFIEKFKKEAQAAARLIHPNIAQIYSYGISDGMPYIAMELVAGGSLWGIMQANPGKTDVTRVLKICQQVAQALQCSTDQGCVHGDIKPENILLDANGNAKLVDFGLAGMQKDTSEIWGTPYYIAPEKVKQEVVDFRADMFNLGGTLYHALTNQPPFEGDDVNAVVKARFLGKPKPPSEVRADLTPAIDALVMRMLEQDKEKRFPSFEALIEEFKKVLTLGLDSPGGSSTATASGAKAATATVGGRRMTVRTRRRMVTKPKVAGSNSAKNGEDESPVAEGTESAKPEGEDEEDRGGNLGLKVIGVVVGVIALIGAIVGGLFWYQAADRKAREEQRQREIIAGIDKARQVLVNTRTTAEKFAIDFAEYTGKAVASCKKTSEELKKILPDWAAELDMPAPASTNAPSTPATDEEKAKNRPAVLDDMHDLWLKAQECERFAANVRAGISNVLVVCDSAVMITGTDEESMNKLGTLSREAAEKYDMVKVSKDVENAKKASGYIKQKGESSVKQAVNRLRLERLEAERKAKKEREAAEDKAREAAAATAKQLKVEAEKAAARAKFDSLIVSGVLRQLDWNGARRQLEAVKNDCKTAEGEAAANEELLKIECMQLAQDSMAKNMVGYSFKVGKGKLRGHKVKKVDPMMIELVKPDGKSSHKLSWVKFYQEYHGNLNELINNYVCKGRDLPKNRLSLKDWSKAMCGAALTMRILCGDDQSASTRGEQIVNEVAKAFPEYTNKLEAMFPDVKIKSEE